MATLKNGSLVVNKKNAIECFLLLEFIALGGTQFLNPLTNIQATNDILNVTLNMDKAEQENCLKYVNGK